MTIRLPKYRKFSTDLRRLPGRRWRSCGLSHHGFRVGRAIARNWARIVAAQNGDRTNK